MVISKKLLNLSKTADEQGAQQACNNNLVPSFMLFICFCISKS